MTDTKQTATTFGRYELLELLAVGGMAEIFMARTRLGGIAKTCVIKRILPEYSSNRQFVSMFIDEARITIGLDHENVVKLLDFGQVDGAYFMAIDYVDGCDLVDLLRAAKSRGEGLPPMAAAHIARAMARGLAAAHEARDHRGQPMGIVHRDVSPQNVFIGWDGSVKIGDFGIASARNKLTRTLPGTVKGKFGYMSPEQSQGGSVDHRTDVWAVGVVLWEMLVGGRLFATDNPVETLARVIEMPVAPPSEVRPAVPQELDRVVLSTLCRPLSLRMSSANELADALDVVIAGGFGPRDLELALPQLGLSRATQQSARVRGKSPAAPPLRERTRTIDPTDEKLRALHEELRKNQSLWSLVDIGERHAVLGHRGEALSAIRTAAAVFAHRGLLVQALCAAHALKPLVDRPTFEAELNRLAKLRSHDRERLTEAMDRLEHKDFWELVREADPAGLGVEQTEQTLVRHPAPLLGSVTTADFVRLGKLARVEKKAQGSTVVREGDKGDALYAVGRGRVVVHTASHDDEPSTTNRPRVYLGALTEGDFFGEFSFLTQSPRSATVEAASDCLVLRLDRVAVDELVATDASFREPLLEFYKERVAELILAKNPILGALPPEARRGLIKNASVHKYLDSSTIVKEGDDASELFFIIAGEVEVFRREAGLYVFINKLHEGQFFGEMAALQRTPRMASVRAMGDVEVMTVSREEIERILDLAEDVRVLFQKAMTARQSESEERVRETTRIFEGI
ncbi:MAG: serine/threonine-protein kinase [Deltaproteobacteria bacterium]|nr:serine/threonine-protein kinase [Deltaproteobacteria bacterium]